MLRASNEYKEIMNRHVRNRGYVTVSIGVINQESQQDAKVSTTPTYYSKGAIFDNELIGMVDYATLETDYLPCDGSFLFMPENKNEIIDNGLTFDFGQTVRIDFGQEYPIKGLTIDFGTAYPSNLTITTKERTEIYTNIKSGQFVANETFGDTDFILITPNQMSKDGYLFVVSLITTTL